MRILCQCFKKQGDSDRAGQYKCAARIAIEHIIPWLKQGETYHIKNCYANDSMFGCEKYAYFDKYMITTASWLYLAYAMADDGIEEVDCPAISKNYICETSHYFHKVMCKFGDYFVEFDTKADEHYDASGLGRIHKKGAPSAICLSVPFSGHPNYVLDVENPSQFSVCSGIKTNDGYEYTFSPRGEYKLVEKNIEDQFIRLKFELKTENGTTLYETCTISDDGVEINASGEGEIEILFPMFKFDGKNYTNISVSEKSAVISYKGYKCIYSTDGIIADKKTVYANRNGHYNAAAATGNNSVLLKIEIVKE